LLRDDQQAGGGAYIAPKVDAMIVAGEHFSSNACRLAEVAEAAGCPAVQLVSDASRIDWSLLPKQGSVGISAAASTPEIIVTGILDALRDRYRIVLEEVEGAEESVEFKPVQVG
jgi:4-hydroxy-3-methylbut-2-enyl diphosphate reductase